jgi:hypothetical protein
MPGLRRVAFMFALTMAIAQVTRGGSPHARSSQVSTELRARMETLNRALGVECTHCHVDGKWTDDTKPAFGIARNMLQMVSAINDRLQKPDRVACWTCHRGEVRPSRQPRPLLDAELAKWPAGLAGSPDALKLSMAVNDVALGVTCSFCHAADWKSADKPTMKMAATMNGLFDIFPKFMPATARTQCFMCHKGSTTPPSRP